MYGVSMERRLVAAGASSNPQGRDSSTAYCGAYQGGRVSALGVSPGPRETELPKPGGRAGASRRYRVSETLAYRVEADYYCTRCGVPRLKPKTITRPCGRGTYVQPVFIDAIEDAAEIAGRRCHTCGEELRP